MGAGYNLCFQCTINCNFVCVFGLGGGGGGGGGAYEQNIFIPVQYCHPAGEVGGGEGGLMSSRRGGVSYKHQVTVYLVPKVCNSILVLQCMTFVPYYQRSLHQVKVDCLII